jgi:hypothetical protein
MRTRAGLTVFERERIGLRPSRGSSPAGRLTHASIHHGGPEGAPRMTYAAAAKTWRGWQAYHMDSPDHGWNDIGYNLGVDGLGRLYEGRPVGTLPAAVGNHNTGSVGIVFIQDGRHHELTPDARRTLQVLFEHGIPELGLPALKTMRVRGHREYAGHTSNACPGEKIMRHLAWRRDQY